MRSQYAENRAWLVRRALGLKGPSDPRAVWHLVDWLGDAVEVRQLLGVRPTCLWSDHGKAKIRVPLRLGDERREALELLHEIGHLMAWSGYAGARGRKLRTWAASAEAEAEHFAEAFLLPPAALASLRSQEDVQTSCEITTLGPEAVARRLAEVQGWEPPRQPPVWSAWSWIRVERMQSPVFSYLELSDRHSSWRAQVPGDCRGLERDLVALKPGEFKAKYGRHQLARRPVSDSWQRRVEGRAG